MNMLRTSLILTAGALALFGCTQNFDRFFIGFGDGGSATSSGGGDGGSGASSIGGNITGGFGGGTTGGAGGAGGNGGDGGGSTGGGPIADPTDIAGLSLWLEAGVGITEDGGGVSGWQDQSGNANHASQSQGTRKPMRIAAAIGGQDAVRFDGVNDALEIADHDSLDPGDESYLLMAVSRYLNDPLGDDCLAAKTNSIAGATTPNWRVMRTGIFHTLQIRYASDLQGYAPLSTDAVTQPTPHVLAWGVDAARRWASPARCNRNRRPTTYR